MMNVTTAMTKNRWVTLASIGMVSMLAVTGCSRSEQKDGDESGVDSTQVQTSQEQENAANTPQVPAVDCGDILVQEQLKGALRSDLTQQTQSLVTSYAQQARIDAPVKQVNQKISTILIDVENPSVLQVANDTDMTTCQASVSMTLPSQDLYQSSQVYAAAGQPNLQERLSSQNIRLNNNMLVDDNFSYVVGRQDGKLKIRIVGQPVLINLVSDVLAGSIVQSAIDTKREQIQEERAHIQQQQREQQLKRLREREDRLKRQQLQPIQTPRPINSVPPTEPVLTPDSEPSTDTSSNDNNVANSSTSATNQNGQAQKNNTNLTVPKDDSIEMVIIEDPNSTY